MQVELCTRNLQVTGVVKKIDDFERLIIMLDGLKIPMDDVVDIDVIFKTR